MIEKLTVTTGAGREVLITWREYQALVGTISAKLCAVSGHGTLTRLFVLPGWRRAGLGQALVRQGLLELRDAGCHRAFVLVNPQGMREEAVLFFDSVGFEAIEGSEFSPPLGSLVMMREIERDGEILPLRKLKRGGLL
jgi:N-acetylglutamate synthase-like GNAT family acetyltransferase|tara:strand:+ start:2047 stop:2460 length:414 start_codon:yes stop_codon:yes gene_type:complete